MGRFYCVLALGLASCVVHSDRSHEWVRQRASDDLRCPKGQITVHHYTKYPKKKGVVGCGHRVTYVERCQGNRCWWEQDPNAPPPKDPG